MHEQSGIKLSQPVPILRILDEATGAHALHQPAAGRSGLSVLQKPSGRG